MNYLVSMHRTIKTILCLLSPKKNGRNSTNWSVLSQNNLGNSAVLVFFCSAYLENTVRFYGCLKPAELENSLKISQSLFGSAEDAFYIGGPNVKDVAVLLADTLPALEEQTHGDADEKRYTSQEAVELIGERLSVYFGDRNKARVQISDAIVADAAAGAEVIKIRGDAVFSERELRALEVHEGWVHLGTTLNGLHQPYCTFLSKGPPSSTLTQEGLA